jgi:opacity protein-like surface antigen
MMKRYLTILLLSCLSISLCAQEQEKHEFTLGASLGYSTMKLFSSLKPAGNVSIGYNFFFNDVVGLGTGLEWSRQQWQSTMESFSDSYQTHDGEEPFVLHSSFSGYNETQTASFLMIPFALRFQYPLLSDNNLTYFSIGGKAGFPLRSRYKTSGTIFTTSAYYPAYDVLLESPESRGLGTFTGNQQNAGIDLKAMWMLSVETGMKWDISNQFSLYTGINIDYSLNSIIRDTKKQFLVYDPLNPTNYTFNSMLNAQYIQDNISKNFVKRANPFYIGIVLRLAYKLPD